MVPFLGAGHPDDSLQILQEGERLAIELNDERSLAILYSMMNIYYLQTGGIEGITYGEKAFQAADKIQDLELMATTGVDLCIAYCATGELLRVVDIAPRVITLFEETQKESESFGKGWNLYSALLALYGYALGGLGRFKEGEAQLEKALDFASEINDRLNIGFVELQYGALFLIKGDGKNAVEHAIEAIKYGDEVQVIPFSSTGYMLEGWGYYFLGEFETATMHLDKALQLQRNAGISQNMSLIHIGLGVVHLDSGQLDNARSCIEEALKLAQNNNERLMEGLARMWLGRILGKADPSQGDNAEEYILHGIKILDEWGMKPFSSWGHFFLGELYADMGQREKALEYLKKAEGMFQEMGMDYWPARTQEVLERVEG